MFTRRCKIDLAQSHPAFLSGQKKGLKSIRFHYCTWLKINRFPWAYNISEIKGLMTFSCNDIHNIR